ncbi:MULTISPECIES: fructosamine kinase family protein [unclassified Streptomyces]|uniref:fructosamine kinase family protein n=1 Tax=unclassified Streptomyces TaxID=2593676 RepID=UPI002E29E760|nr:fructosamine kinase family protein [Streptomyces sp. NBC_00223]
MKTASLPPLPTTCRSRLTAHYGSPVEAWLDRVPDLLTTAARRWDLNLTGYHDTGHASVLATALDSQSRPVLVKVWPDPDRYSRETAALRLWHPGPGRIVLASDDDLSAAALRMIAAQPGGDEPPLDQTSPVAEAIQQAHSIGRSVSPGTFPLLSDHLRDEILPHIRKRQATSLYGLLTTRVAPHLAGLSDDPARRTVLHADLYRENVAFNRHGRPVLLDPLPMEGDAVFDWAFWSLYYRLGHDTEERLREAARRSGVARVSILPWCLLIGLDGLLYYEETGDPRLDRMAGVLAALCSYADRGPGQ